MNRLTTLTVTLLVFLVPLLAMAGKKFPCPGVPANRAKAESRAIKYFDAGLEQEKAKNAIGALERLLCSLKMQSDANTMFEIEKVAFNVEPRKNAIKLLIKFKNRNRKNASAPDVKDLIEKLRDPNAAPAGPTDNETADTPAAPVAETTAEPIPAGSSQEPAPMMTGSQPRLEDTTLLDAEIAVQNNNDPAKDPRAHKLKVAGVTSVVGGTLLVALGVTAHILAMDSKKTAEESTSYDKFTYYQKKLNNRLAGTVAGYGIGAVAIAVGAALIAKSEKPVKQERDEFGDKQATLHIYASPMGLGLSGQF